MQTEFDCVYMSAVVPTSPTPQTQVSNQCLNDADMTPEIFMQKTTGCQITDSHSDDASMSWKMACTSPSGGQMDGIASFQSTGATLQGSMSMIMPIRGQTVSFEQSWTGKRLGPCD